MDDSSDNRKPRGPSTPTRIGQLASRLFENSSPRDMECPRCGQPVQPMEVPVPAFMGFQRRIIPGRCRACDEEERQREQAEREARVARARSLGGNGSGLVLTAPRLHQIKPDVDNVLAFKALAELVRDGGRSPRAYWLWGAVGTGKSYLAEAAMLSLYDAGTKVAAYSELALQDDIEAAAADSDSDRPMERLNRADILLIDDMDRAERAAAARRAISSLIHRRYAAQRWSIVFTSNRPIARLEGYEDYILSRLGQMCEGRVISLAGPDRRRKR